MPIPKRVNKDFFKQWTPEMAYVLGFFAADGYLTLTKRGTDYWNIQITDRDILEKIKLCIQAEHKISVRLRTGNESTLYRLQIGSKEMCTDLYKLGMTERKTKSMSLPHVPDEYLPDFVRGYFDGDGNIWSGTIHKNRITQHFALLLAFTSSSREFLMALRSRLRAKEIIGGSLYEPKQGCYRLQYSTQNALKLYSFMYNQAGSNGLFLERKRIVFEKFTQFNTMQR